MSARCVSRTATANCRRWRTRRAWSTSVMNTPFPNGRWTPRTTCSAWTTTVACFVRAASGCAGTLKARVRRTFRAGAAHRRSSPISTSRGAKRSPAPRAASACNRARPARCSTKARRWARWNATAASWNSSSPPARRNNGSPPIKFMKIRLATVWLGGCAGCHMSFLDLDEFLIDLADAVDLVYSPIVDVKEFPENVDLCLIEGAVCNADNLEILHKIRARSKVLVSFGDCAVTGNVPAMRNQFGIDNADNVLQCAYIENAQNNPNVPKADGIVPQLLEWVLPVHEVVHVE